MVKNIKTGLVLCECGNNISNFVDLDAVRNWALDNKKVDFVLKHELLCAPHGKEYVHDLFKKHKPDHLIIAACSPLQHEATFQNIAQASGGNLADVQMANIREHCAWVTPNKEEATKKAIALINGAIHRSAYHEKLKKQSMDVETDVVIIGGGLAGMEAALLAAQAGRKVTIIEKNISLGGRIIQSEELAPMMDCSPCLISPRLFKINDHPNITVLSNSQVTEVLGFYGNFTIKGETKARYVNDTCIGCEACFDACPVSVKSDFHLGLGDRKAIYTLYPGAVPAAAVIDKESCLHFKGEDCQACVGACPFSSIDFDDYDQSFELSAGAIILATGFTSLQSESLTTLGYQKLPNMLTLPEFERLTNSNGPTQGTLNLTNGQPPQSVAVIHCVGSLTDQGLPYCSGICCQLASKVGQVVRNQNPGAKVYNLHDRLVFNTPSANQFHQQQLKAGTQFIKTDKLNALTITQEGALLKIEGQATQPLLVDMVVLVTGIIPGPDTEQLSTMMLLEQTDSGFFKPDHYLLREHSSTIDGIYAVGGCSGPYFANQVVTQAQAAAGDAISRLVPGRKISLETMTASINKDCCSGCKLCISSCPYRAIARDGLSGKAEVNEAICRGCGTCVATCPSGAAEAKHFTRTQLESEIEGVLND